MKSRIALTIILFPLCFITTGNIAFSSDKTLEVLCTTFPIYQITRNVVQGSASVSVELMLPSSLGCPHDYSLTTNDMKKISMADVLIINGQGMEEFLGAPTKRANSNITIIDSSAGIMGLMEFVDDDHNKGSHHGKGERHHKEINPHLFTSPKMCALISQNIAAGLSRVDKKSAAFYTKNAADYSTRMNRLAEDIASQVRLLKNRNIVTQHGAFDYLARDSGLNIVAVIQSHPGHEPSAYEIISLVKEIKEKNAGAVFYEPQYSRKTSFLISKEDGIPAAPLDPCATGPENADLNYYETIMKKNITILKTTLGVR